jgi:hypothetical protein
MRTLPLTEIDIIKSETGARVVSWTDGSRSGFNPLGADTRTDEEIIASLSHDEIGARVDFIHIERFVLTTYLDGTTERTTHSEPVYCSQKYHVVRIPGETQLRELRRRYDREIAVHPSLTPVIHVFANGTIAA